MKRKLRPAGWLVVAAGLGLFGCSGSRADTALDRLTMKRASMGQVQEVTDHASKRTIDLEQGFDPSKDIGWPAGSGSVEVGPAVFSPSAQGFVRDYTVRSPSADGEGTCALTVVVPTNEAGDVRRGNASATVTC